MRKFVMAAMCAAGMALAGSASAAVVNLDQTIDVNSATLLGGGSQYTFGPSAFSAFAPITIGLGDELDWTIHFEPGQTLTLLNVNRVTASAVPFSPGTTIFRSDNPTLSFLGANGLPFGSATIPHSATLNLAIQAEAGYSGPITISGLRFVAPVSGVTFGPGDPVTFSTVQQLTITDYGIGSSAVPEPSTWVLMIGGLGLAGAAFRRRTRIRHAHW